MVYLITGDINSGKSTYLLALYQKTLLGDGFYNRKIYGSPSPLIYGSDPSPDFPVGQEIVWLSTGIRYPFAYRLPYIPKNWDEIYTYKDFSFSKIGILFADAIMEHILLTSDPAFIDELGPLELLEKGHYHNFSRLLMTKKDIYAVVRKGCLYDIIEKFKIRNYKILFPI